MSMPPIQIGCGAIRGVDAVPVVLEVSLRNGTGTPRILGLADAGVREAYYRILGAFGAQGLPAPRGVPTINFAPATVRKTGSGFDLPMALGLAAASGQFDTPSKLAAVGEVSLRGDILPTAGVVSVALAARAQGWTHLLTDARSAPIAALVPGIDVFGVATLRQALCWLRGEARLPRAQPPSPGPAAAYPDLIDIRGHETPKTAMMVAAAGRHNLLMVGPPGSGKTALVARLPGLLPPTTEEEALEVLKIHTVNRGAIHDGSLPDYTRRPVRCPHHTSSAASLLGGGADPGPGEVTLAQHGLLFLDELPEFRREVLEGLRQPLEDGHLTIGRVRRTVTMPADFLLVCAMNPCQCGYHGHDQRPCVCNPAQRQRYRARVSGPLLDRLDLQIEVPALPPAEWHRDTDPDWSTARVRERVMLAVDRQQQRSRGRTAWPNGRLRDGDLEAAVGAGDDIRRALEEVLRIHSMSGRARVRLLRIARTIADLDDRDAVVVQDIHGAARLRGYGVEI
jgi:magnesium chelatase family protein